MSSLWTPGGERPVPPRGAAGPADATGERGRRPAAGPPPDDTAGFDAAEPDAAARAELAALRRQLAEAPVEAVVANHCYGLFELAALHLSVDPPNLSAARLAVDALAALVEGLAGRLGGAEPQLRDGLAQIRLAFVQVSAARGAPAPADAPGADAPDGPVTPA